MFPCMYCIPIYIVIAIPNHQFEKLNKERKEKSVDLATVQLYAGLAAVNICVYEP